MKKTLKVFTGNHRHIRRESPAKHGASQSGKPLGSETLRDALLPKLMKGEVRVKP